MRHISDDERRARLAVRHGIAPGARFADAVEATDAMTVLHATDLTTVYLSLFARVNGIRPEDVDAALYESRTLVKQMAMRRTLFVFSRALLPAALGSAAARVATQEGARLARDAVASGLAADGETWLASTRDAVVARLSRGDTPTTRQLRDEIPEVAGTILTSPNSRWGGEVPILPRLLTYLTAAGIVARGPNLGHWRISKPSWTLLADWLGEPITPTSEADGYAELIRHWLWTFGPGTETDIAWWLGSPLGPVRQALATLEAVEVRLDDGATGWILPDDSSPTEPARPWAALLPVLDPTTMGWKGRGFYLGPHGPDIFDSVGNGGTTAWWNGRIVGCWIQLPDGEISLVLLEKVSAAARDALEAEAARLREWLGDVRIATVWSGAAMRAAKEAAAKGTKGTKR